MPSTSPDYPENPKYSQTQTRKVAARIAADGGEHEVRVLFVNEIRMRVEGEGVVSLAGDDVAEAAIAGILDQFRPLTLSPVGPAVGRTEEELTKEQQELQEKEKMFFPHRGAYAVISLEVYSPESAVALFAALDESPYVQSVEVVGYPTF